MNRITGSVFALATLIACGGAVAPAATPTDDTPKAASIVVTEAMGSPHVGDTAPDFDLTDASGVHVKLADLRGSVVMLAFVTSWCPFSEAEQPNLAKLADDYRGKKVRVLAIDIKEPEAGYQKYLHRVPMSFPVLWDKTGDVVASFTPAHAQPDVADRSTVLVTSNLVIDPAGKVRFFTMVDTAHFDATLVFARRAIDAVLAEGG